MSIKVYAISGSPSAWRVLLALTFKQLEYDVQYLNLSEQEHKSEAYLEINPRGTVPSLVSNGVTLRDSMAILAWLDRAYPDKPLFGHTPEQAAHIWQVTMEASEHLRNANKGLLLPIFFQGADKKTDELAQVATTQRSEMQKLEALLVRHDFIGGDYPCAADAVCFPEARMLKRALDTKAELMEALGYQLDLSDFPDIAAWIGRIEAFEGVNKTLPPHWS